MSSYSFVISTMTWSYSRLTCFEQCPYKFLLTYLHPSDERPQFFSDYGSFVHGLLEKYYHGELQWEELSSYYLIHFYRDVIGRAPSDKVFAGYFLKGLDYFRHGQPPDKVLDMSVIGVEKEVHFDVGGYPFIGYIDLIGRDQNGIIQVDHKSRELKPRSKRGKYTKGDELLDEYLRQLYLYSIPTFHEFGQYPDNLAFNCYRAQTIVVEPFRQEMLRHAEEWAVHLIERIKGNNDWRPNLDYYTCTYLCGKHDSCEYYEMEFGKNKQRW